MSGARQREVIVRDPSGLPVAGAIVEVVQGSAVTPEVGRITDAKGTLRITLPPGRFMLRASTGQGEVGVLEIENDGDEIIEIRVAG